MSLEGVGCAYVVKGSNCSCKSMVCSPGVCALGPRSGVDGLFVGVVGSTWPAVSPHPPTLDSAS